jgi:hypothetical protein
MGVIQGGWRLEIIKRNDSAEGFVVLPYVG